MASGVRYDLAVESPAYVKELVTHHVGGYLKIAPEHTEDGPLAKMMKPGIGTYDRFKEMFDQAAEEGRQEIFPDPLFHRRASRHDRRGHDESRARGSRRTAIAPTRCRPSCPRRWRLRPRCITPASIRCAACGAAASEKVEAIKGLRQRRLHKAFLRYHDPDNWPLLREALKRDGPRRPDRLAASTSWCRRTSRAGTGKAAGTRRPVRPGDKTQRFTTKGLRVMK